jgi:hypothetical protein
MATQPARREGREGCEQSHLCELAEGVSNLGASDAQCADLIGRHHKYLPQATLRQKISSGTPYVPS